MHPLQTYEKILFRNISHITNIELFIRFLYYTLPGRFGDSKFASQTLYSGLSLIRLYHNSILRRAADQGANGIEESAFNKYKRYWSNKSQGFRIISLVLSVIGYTQLWMEMGHRKGFRKTYYYIAGLEMIKSMLNLATFRLTNRRMQLYPHHMERHAKPSSLAPQSPSPHWTGQRTGKEVPLMTTMINTDETKGTDVNSYLMSKTLTAEQVRQPQQMVRVMSFWATGGEMIYMMRPTIYVFAILVWGRRSWKPWYLSLVMDLLSNVVIRCHGSMLPLEKHEYQRRLKLLALYLMKGAFYSRITRPKLERLCDGLDNTPLPNILSVVCRDYLSLWERIYFYTSGS